MTATTQSAKEEFVALVKAGAPTVLRDYFERLRDDEETGVDDLRKAVDLFAKVMGAHETEKTDNLMQVSWVINGGNVSFEVKKDAPAIDVTDVTEIVELAPTLQTDQPQPVPQEAPPPAPLTFDHVDNLLDQL